MGPAATERYTPFADGPPKRVIRKQQPWVTCQRTALGYLDPTSSRQSPGTPTTMLGLLLGFLPSPPGQVKVKVDADFPHMPPGLESLPGRCGLQREATDSGLQRAGGMGISPLWTLFQLSRGDADTARPIYSGIRPLRVAGTTGLRPREPGRACARGMFPSDAQSMAVSLCPAL